jgi:hypothetical protein
MATTHATVAARMMKMALTLNTVTTTLAVPRTKASRILLATSFDASSLTKRGFKLRVDDVAGNGPRI